MIMRDYFYELVKSTFSLIRSSEKFTIWFFAEDMEYSRFNKTKIRQAGSVKQRYLTLSLIEGQKHSEVTLGLSGKIDKDKELIALSLKKVRDKILHSVDDPYLLINEAVQNSENISLNTLPDRAEIIDSLFEEANGLDLVGIYVGGPIYKGFANSFGQLNWFHKSSFVIDSSIYYERDQAIKQCYADTHFDRNVLNKKINEARLGLELFLKKAVTISPGEYRVYLSPSALHEIFSLLNWGGFSKKYLETKNSPLRPLYDQKKELAKKFSLTESISSGTGPNFQEQGFLKPETLPIIEQGKLINTLISPKTGKEYGISHNAAQNEESMTSLAMRAGELDMGEVLTHLKDGLYINNLWYLNYSDRQNGCITGLTRFFCFVVKNGVPTAPFKVMRFDDSFYNLFGKNLLAITKERELIIESHTYDERSTASFLLPGVIVENMRFTL